MLVIEINLDGPPPITLAQLNTYNIPSPPNGFDTQAGTILLMKFEDEQEAVDYSYELDSYANTLDNESEEYRIVTIIINAISDDEFVQAYIQS